MATTEKSIISRIKKLRRPKIVRERVIGAEHQKPKERSEMRLGQTLGFAFVSFITFTIIWVMIFVMMGFTSPWVDGLAIGLTTFTLMFWYTFNMWVAYVVDNQIWVYRDRLPPKKAYCLTQGWWLIPPWSELQYKCHSTRTIVVDESWAFQTLSGPRIVVGVFAIIRPRLEDIEKFLNTKEDAVREEFQKIIRMHLGYWIIQMTPDEVMANGPELAKLLAKLFGKENQITEVEDWTGMSISQPKVPSIDLEPKAQADRESVFTMEKSAEAIGKLVAELIKNNGGIITDEIREMAAETYRLARGWEKKVTLNIVGQNGALLVGALPGIFGDSPAGDSSKGKGGK